MRKATYTVLAVGALTVCGCSPQQGAGTVSAPPSPAASTEPSPRPLTVAQLRAGDTIATFSRLNVGASSPCPDELISQQVERLRNAQRT
ncbi:MULTISPECIES: hypothetical protein [unclassified Streptomyces]|uniref:hypothetical protein n=1 Tax=unclassified Streptomyces TaxID=2593676 RepID=UPI0022B70498|nr:MULTISPECIES: hypothetical protein [unclassified Streptomyces]MCZ7417626.1 hypothetical protein [Streptomyces sp. WMMC897]MCZ7432564.1 hypothetical protein [Streptomyces sp. WMMC1477]